MLTHNVPLEDNGYIRQVPSRLHLRVCLGACLLAAAWPGSADDFHPPGGVAYAHTAGNVTILPGGRAIKPMGSQIEIGPGAFGMAISPKGLIGVTDTGFERFGVTILEPHKD